MKPNKEYPELLNELIRIHTPKRTWKTMFCEALEFLNGVKQYLMMNFLELIFIGSLLGILLYRTGYIDFRYWHIAKPNYKQGDVK